MYSIQSTTYVERIACYMVIIQIHSIHYYHDVYGDLQFGKQILYMFHDEKHLHIQLSTNQHSAL